MTSRDLPLTATSTTCAAVFAICPHIMTNAKNKYWTVRRHFEEFHRVPFVTLAALSPTYGRRSLSLDGLAGRACSGTTITRMHELHEQFIGCLPTPWPPTPR